MQAEQSAEQPAEVIGCQQDKSAGSESRLLRGAVNKEQRLVQSDVVIPSTEPQCHPELVSGSQKLRRFRNLSWIIGRSAGSMQPSLGRVPLSLHSCQNPQFGMAINN